MKTLLGVLAGGEWMLPVSLTLTAIVLTLNGGRILEYLNRRSDARAFENQISRHAESVIQSHPTSKA
jgi:hypothetical protein